METALSSPDNGSKGRLRQHLCARSSATRACRVSSPLSLRAGTALLQGGARRSAPEKL